MTAPIRWAQALAKRCCDAQTRERVVDPAIADLQLEYDEAARAHGAWVRHAVLLRGCVALVKAIVMAGVWRWCFPESSPEGQERRAMTLAIGAGTAVAVLGTALLVAMPLNSSPVSPDRAQVVVLAWYLIPQALPMSVPAGLVLGLVIGFGSAADSRRLRIRALVVAALASLACAILLAWVVPASNQRYRTLVFGHPVARGVNELSLAELARAIQPSAPHPSPPVLDFDRAEVALTYHTRCALACAPMFLCCLALAIARQGRWRPGTKVIAGCGALLSYLVVLDANVVLLHATNTVFTLAPAMLIAWMPNLLALSACVALVRQRTSCPT